MFDELFPKHSKSHRRQELCENWIVGMRDHSEECCNDEGYYTKEDIIEIFIEEKI